MNMNMTSRISGRGLAAPPDGALLRAMSSPPPHAARRPTEGPRPAPRFTSHRTVTSPARRLRAGSAHFRRLDGRCTPLPQACLMLLRRNLSPGSIPTHVPIRPRQARSHPPLRCTRSARPSPAPHAHMRANSFTYYHRAVQMLGQRCCE